MVRRVLIRFHRRDFRRFLNHGPRAGAVDWRLCWTIMFFHQWLINLYCIFDRYQDRDELLQTRVCLINIAHGLTETEKSKPDLSGSRFHARLRSQSKTNLKNRDPVLIAEPDQIVLKNGPWFFAQQKILKILTIVDSIVNDL